MKDKVVVVRHGDDPPDDRVYTYLSTHGFDVILRRPFRGEPLDLPAEEVAGTVLHGGPHDVDSFDQNPFLRDEYRWIDDCMKADVPMLGLCQGAQQIAHHLGSRVGPKPDERYEFGYYRVDPVPGADGFLDRARWFAQAHFHTFDMPRDAERLATSAAFENQAFRYGKQVYGFQFHPEVTIEGFRRWQVAPWSPRGKPGAQSEAEQTRLMIQHDRDQADWFYAFMDGFFGRAGAD